MRAGEELFCIQGQMPLQYTRYPLGQKFCLNHLSNNIPEINVFYFCVLCRNSRWTPIMVGQRFFFSCQNGQMPLHIPPGPKTCPNCSSYTVSELNSILQRSLRSPPKMKSVHMTHLWTKNYKIVHLTLFLIYYGFFIFIIKKIVMFN